MSSSLFYNVPIVFESILWFLSKSCANWSRIEHVGWTEGKIIYIDIILQRNLLEIRKLWF